MNKNISKEYLRELIDELIALKENKDELELWFSIYDTLPDDKKELLINNLKTELATLKA